MKKTLVSVIGPTAIGKTKLAIELANHFDTEIISADSRQFFKEMSIGTAVPSKKELAQARHHFIQHISIFENYSVGDFERTAINLITSLFNEKDVLILVGGSGLYIDAVTKGLDKFPKIDSEIRKILNDRLDKNGIEDLQLDLKERDPDYYSKVDLSNPHRVIRALEVCIGTGRPYSSFLSLNEITRNFNTVTVGLTAERQTIYDRINHRVDLMVKEGLVEEAQALLKHEDLNALQTVGYKELFKYFKKEWDFDFAISEIKKNTRRFAKRQITWFKKNEEALWYDYQMSSKEIIKDIEKKL
ncbi:tRNA (adenosine(37)-N6)-dimethylallyltransferase MiaA [Euzebyella marina]|uniref:tRNA dimethylallyltransferase n=1 Tax=Euzebyella marina TaxID=1761453 RepID=A0A3G2L6N8_9FLAO|nr:tRNA (adenosine(37)-N6)-dimethylallyltransferase MiaA [Euzebyella marina]AYN67896.1 tRNA (adenosine(37)-N6)-dimethylallyltransferase MiaA [Euzebyella marina]